MSYFSCTLDCGLRIIHEQTNSPVTYCGFAINTGTRDEASTESGMAHLVEHLIFKGTTHRKAWHILNRMENVGGDLNAYTTKEETVVYSAFMNEYFSRAVELLVDIVYNSTFPQEELEKEIEVVIDEIASYKDSPSELIYDDFEALVFDKHALGRDILGDPEKLRQYTSEDVARFVSRYYKPSNMVFFVRGKLTSNRVLSTLEKFMAPIPSGEVTIQRAPALYLPPKHIVVEKDTHQTHVMLGGRAFGYFDRKRDILFLLNNILGGPGMNSRLNISLREKRGLVYGVDSSVTSYTDAGIFTIYYGVDSDDLDKSLSLVHKELSRLREERLTPLKLGTVKKQLIGQMGVSSDNSESLSLGIARTFLHQNRCDSFEEIAKRFMSISSTELLEVANEVFEEQKLFSLIYK